MDCFEDCVVGSDCGEDGVIDCDGLFCVFWDWVGDGICDMVFLVLVYFSLYCEELGWDGGDCVLLDVCGDGVC